MAKGCDDELECGGGAWKGISVKREGGAWYGT